MESPLISVIVPIYKVEQYLARCLESICGQTYRNLEIICVDDGSPDKSIDILNEFAARDSRIRVIRQTNQGVSVARNAGLAVAKGVWVSFIDSDDWIERETYETCIPYMSDVVDMVVFGVHVDNELQRKDPLYLTMEKECISLSQACLVKYDGVVPFSDEVILGTNVSIWNKLFRRSIVVDNGIAFPIGRWYEDGSFNYAFLLVARCGYYIKGKFCYHYIQRASSTMYKTRQDPPRICDLLEVVRDVYTCMKKHNMDMKRQTLLACIADGFIRDALNYTPKERRTDVITESRRLLSDVGVSHRVEFESISRVRRGVFHRLCRLFYRRRATGLKISFGLFGLMFLSVQRRNFFSVVRLFGLVIWRTPLKKHQGGRMSECGGTNFGTPSN